MNIKKIFPGSEVVAHCHIRYGDIIALRMREASDAYRFIEVTEKNYFNLGNPTHLVRVQRRELPKTLGTIIEIRRLRLVPLNKPILALRRPPNTKYPDGAYQTLDFAPVPGITDTSLINPMDILDWEEVDIIPKNPVS